MRYVYLVLALLIVGCKEKRSEAERSVVVQWEFKGSRIGGEDRWLSQLTLNNTANDPIKDHWELFFDFPSGRVIDTLDLLSNGYIVHHWAGGHYSIKPGPGAGMIPAGDSLMIEIPASGSIIKNSDAPNGFYLVFNENDNDVYFPEVRLHPINNDVLLYKGSSLVERPQAEALYASYTSLETFKKDDLSPITPEPLKWRVLQENFTIDKGVVIDRDPELRHEGLVLQGVLREMTGLSLPVVKDVEGKRSLKLSLDPGMMGEEYHLRVTQDEVVLTGGSPAGVFYGVQSLKALLGDEGGNISLQGIAVEDRPAMAYRGMHLDVARNFTAKEEVLKLLDLMSYYKLNTFHFHLTDDEGWRVEIPGIPELTEVGGRRIHTRDEYDGLFHQYGSARTQSGSGYYTREAYMEILKYAADRHIEVIPEIDLPGHARAAIVALKARERRLLSAGDTIAAKAYRLHEADDRSAYFSVQNYDDNVVNVCMPSAYEFIGKVVDEVQKMHAEAGNPLKTLHIGGDEVPNGVWEKSSACMAMFPGEEPLAAKAKDYFVEQVNELLGQRGIRMAGWEEIGLVHGREGKTVNTDQGGPDAPLLYHWKNTSAEGAKLGQELAAAGYPVVLSHVTHLYFDMAYSSSPEEPGFYWGGFVDTKKVFGFATPESMTGIKGIQGQLWSETVVSKKRMEYMVFPKMIALAERAWKGDPKTSPVKAWSDFAARLGYFELDRLDKFHGGVHYRLPPPGGVIQNDTLYLNAAWPGLELYYSEGGASEKDQVRYLGPVRVTRPVEAVARRRSGRTSRTIRITPSDPLSPGR